MRPADWAERRGALLHRLAEVSATWWQLERDGAHAGDLAPYRKQVAELRNEYADNLPPVPIARDPISGQVISVRVDVGGLDGPYWDYQTPARPFEPLPPTYVVHSGAMALDLDAIENTKYVCCPGPPVPYVVPELLGRDGVQACISSVPVGAHSGYAITYFSPRASEPGRLTNEWGSTAYWVRDRGEPVIMNEAYETWPEPDFELGPWLERGKVAWVEPGDSNWRLNTGAGGCPYLDLPGKRTHQHLQFGTVW